MKGRFKQQQLKKNDPIVVNEEQENIDEQTSQELEQLNTLADIIVSYLIKED